MPDLLIQVDEAKLAEVQKTLAGIKNGLPRVLTRAINKVAGRAYTETVRRLAVATGLKQKFVRKGVRLTRASWRVLAALLRVRRKRAPLLWFQATQTARGVAFRAPAGADWAENSVGAKRGRRLIEHAFIQTMPSGHKGVFLRRGKKPLPIDELFGASLADIFLKSGGMFQRLAAETGTLLSREIDVQVRVLLEQQSSGVFSKAESAFEPKEAA